MDDKVKSDAVSNVELQKFDEHFAHGVSMGERAFIKGWEEPARPQSDDVNDFASYVGNLLGYSRVRYMKSLAADQGVSPD